MAGEAFTCHFWQGSLWRTGKGINKGACVSYCTRTLPVHILRCLVFFPLDLGSYYYWPVAVTNVKYFYYWIAGNWHWSTPPQFSQATVFPSLHICFLGPWIGPFLFASLVSHWKVAWWVWANNREAAVHILPWHPEAALHSSSLRPEYRAHFKCFPRFFIAAAAVAMPLCCLCFSMVLHNAWRSNVSINQHEGW